MRDFSPVSRREVTIAEFSRDLTIDDLRAMTDEMLDTIEGIIVDATDADVVFQPVDPNANDTFGNPEEASLAWTLGHVIVHATASSEEGAALSSVLARGIVVEGRSRYETEWRTVTTIAQVRQRLGESRRMRHAFLDTWPDEPHLDVAYEPIPGYGPMNATARFVMGLLHENSHLEQLREIMRQAQAAR